MYGDSCRYSHRKADKPPLVTSKKKNEEVYSLPKIPGPVSLAAAAGLEINTGVYYMQSNGCILLLI
jgi:E3 ubiquitin-protein ligase makorin